MSLSSKDFNTDVDYPISALNDATSKPSIGYAKKKKQDSELRSDSRFG